MSKSNVASKKLRDGFYLEVRNKGEHSGIKIRRDSKVQLHEAQAQYQKVKEVVILGEVKNGKWVTDKTKK